MKPDKRTDTEISIKVTSYYWSKQGRKYNLYTDNIKVLETKDFDLINKEIRKYFKLRFKE